MTEQVAVGLGYLLAGCLAIVFCGLGILVSMERREHTTNVEQPVSIQAWIEPEYNPPMVYVMVHLKEGYKIHPLRNSNSPLDTKIVLNSNPYYQVIGDCRSFLVDNTQEDYATVMAWGIPLELIDSSKGRLTGSIRLAPYTNKFSLAPITLGFEVELP